MATDKRLLEYFRKYGASPEVMALMCYTYSLPLELKTKTRVDEGFLKWEEMVRQSIQVNMHAVFDNQFQWQWYTNERDPGAELVWEKLRKFVDQWALFGTKYPTIKKRWIAGCEENGPFMAINLEPIQNHLEEEHFFYRGEGLLLQCFLAYLKHKAKHGSPEEDIFLDDDDVTRICLLVRSNYHGSNFKTPRYAGERFRKIKIPTNGDWPTSVFSYGLGLYKRDDFLIAGHLIARNGMAFWVVLNGSYRLCIPKFLQRYIFEQTESLRLPHIPAWAGGENNFYTVEAEPDEWSEKAIRLWIENNPNLIEVGLELKHPGQKNTLEFPVASGRIDLLGRGTDGSTVVIELKKGTASHNTVAQIQRYMSSVEDSLASQGPVRGIIVATGYSQGFEHAVNGCRFKLKMIKLKSVTPKAPAKTSRAAK